MTTEIFENALIVREDAIHHGWVAVANGLIAEMGEGRAPERGLDLAGDYLMPGLVELHTDHLESHAIPRPRVAWHPLAAVVAYDAQIAASGITSVFDSLRVGSDPDGTLAGPGPMALADAVAVARAEGLLRAEHRTHLRCEVCAPDALTAAEAFLARYDVHLISLMDHTPGDRQFRDIEKWKIYFGGKGGLNDTELDNLIATRREQHERNHDRQRAALVGIARERGIVVASHDDTTADHVAEARRDGVAIAEFPTTVEAAQLSHEAGIGVMMGAPNVVRGGSHSGNVAAETLARDGLLDILSSDYVPASLLMGAFELDRRIEGYGLARAVRLISRQPAVAAGLSDRGAIATGLRADLIRVHRVAELPVVRAVWREGRRVV
ncbi:MAG: alpha-D-ribose 1-methylphosphonate 5-triphosphate diphosphatase [Hyphomicrobiaceae bacterium]|nr:alpha-D-ribose 1-methylphosphonate 5-triphosphate diphosphatase [Hyphomicrobiaceae bacterium]